MAVTYTKKISYWGNKKVVYGTVTYASGDTAISIATGLRRIDAYYFSPTSVSAKYITLATVSGGTISATATDPLAACYFYYTAIGV